MNDFGIRLRKLRKQKRMTLDVLAEKSGTSKQVLSRYENGDRVPKISMVQKIANALGVSMSELVGEEYSSIETIEKNDTNVDNYFKTIHRDDNRIWEYREQLRRDPSRKVLFDLAENGTIEDVEAAVSLIEALKKTNPGFYDGDDPA